MESSDVLSNRASICSHALTLLSPTRWSVMTGWRTSIGLQPFVQTRLDCGSSLYTSISLHPGFQTCPFCGSLSAHTHQSPALCVSSTVFQHIWIMVRVWVQASASCFLVKHVPCLRTRISRGSLSVHTHPFPVCLPSRSHLQEGNTIPICKDVHARMTAL